MLRKSLLLLVLLPLVASAQSVVVGQQALAWDQNAPTRIEAQSLGYTLYVDSAPGLVLANVGCTGTVSPFHCKANLPPLTSGTHDLALTASLNGETTAKSVPLSIQVVIIAVPQNLSIEKP